LAVRKTDANLGTHSEQAAMRDLIRTGKQAVDAMEVARQRLLGFPLRNGLRYEVGKYWTQRRRHWPCLATGCVA